MSINFTTYRGYKVFHLHPYYTNPSGSLNIKTDRVGSTFGYNYAHTIQSYNEFMASFVYRISGLDNISAVIDLFDEVKGRWRGLWFPSWVEDFKLNADIGYSDTSLSVLKADDFETMYPIQNKTGWNIFIYVNQDEWYARRITGQTGNTISIESALGTSYTKEQVKFICFLYRGRSDFDTLEINFIIPEVAEFQMAFAETPYEYTSTTTTAPP
jgi:hypothetical protein